MAVVQPIGPWVGVGRWTVKGFEGVGKMVEELLNNGHLADVNDRVRVASVCRRIMDALGGDGASERVKLPSG